VHHFDVIAAAVQLHVPDGPAGEWQMRGEERRVQATQQHTRVKYKDGSSTAAAPWQQYGLLMS
jgi:hypothetical protein